MNLKLKSLVLAVALAACAGSASAALDKSTTGATTGVTATSGGSELVFFAWSAGKSYIQDLGMSVSEILGTNLSTPLKATVSSAYDTFVAASGTNVIRWGVLGVHSSSTNVNASGIDWALSTVRSGTTASALAGQKSSLVNGMPAIFDTFATAANKNAGFAAADGSYYADATTGDNWATSLKSNFASKFNFNTDNAVSATAKYDFYLFNSVGATTAAPIETKLGGFASFDGHNIVVAVPEPESYAMLLSGLFMLGAIARRRIIKS